MPRLGEAFRAGILLLGLLSLLGGFSQLVRTMFWSEIRDSYRHSFSWSPGSHFGRSITALKREGDHTCVVLGNSAAREGIDPSALEADLPGFRFVNAATTGGNNLVFELQARLLMSHEARARCILVVMNSWNMFSNARPRIVEDDYLALLDWDDLAGLSYGPLASREATGLATGLILPLKPQGVQLSRLLRSGLWRWRAQTGHGVPLAHFAYFPGELDPAKPYLYHGRDILSDDWDKLVARSREYYDPARYGGAEERTSLGAALQGSLALSPDTMILILPQSPILERASRIADPSFRKAFAPYRSRVGLIDCSDLNELGYFYDEGHLNARGRTVLSAALALALQGESGPCRVEGRRPAVFSRVDSHDTN